MSSPRYVLTIATGKKLYVDMAVNLARSFLWWHKQSDIRFQLVTDQDGLVPSDVKSKIGIINIRPGELGEGFSPKLYLDKLTAQGQTLFIDSDCLIFGSLDKIFEAFKNHPVSVVGGYIAAGEWFGDIKNVCRQFNVPHLPKFNGGIYYLEQGPVADRVYKRARALEQQYDEIGFVRLRNRPNDEVIMALAMQLEGMTPVADDGTFMSDPQSCPGKYTLDVINGKTKMINPPAPDPMHRNWYPFEKVSPVIVHFLGSFTQDYPYQKETYRLRKAGEGKLNWLAELSGSIAIEYPERLLIFFKDTFRSAYHRLFGVRKIKTSERVIN